MRGELHPAQPALRILSPVDAVRFADRPHDSRTRSRLFLGLGGAVKAKPASAHNTPSITSDPDKRPGRLLSRSNELHQKDPTMTGSYSPIASAVPSEPCLTCATGTPCLGDRFCDPLMAAAGQAQLRREAARREAIQVVLRRWREEHPHNSSEASGGSEGSYDSNGDDRGSSEVLKLHNSMSDDRSSSSRAPSSRSA